MLKRAFTYKFLLYVIAVFLMPLSCKNRSNSNETKIPKKITKVNIYESSNNEDEFLLFERYYDHGKIIREEQFGKPGTNYHCTKKFHYNKLNLLTKEINTLTNNGTKTETKSLYTYDSKGKIIKEFITQGNVSTISTFLYDEKGLLVEKQRKSNNSILGTEIFKYEYDKNDSLSSQSHYVNGSLNVEKYLRKGNKVYHKIYSSGQITEQTEIIYKNGVIVYSKQQTKEQIGTSKFVRKFRAKCIGKNIIEIVTEERYSYNGPNGDKIVCRYEYY